MDHPAGSCWFVTSWIVLFFWTNGTIHEVTRTKNKPKYFRLTPDVTFEAKPLVVLEIPFASPGQSRPNVDRDVERKHQRYTMGHPEKIPREGDFLHST